MYIKDVGVRIHLYQLPMHVGASALHSPSGESPLPLHINSVEDDKAKPVLQVKEHELPYLLPLLHSGSFPPRGAKRVGEQVIAKTKKNYEDKRPSLT